MPGALSAEAGRAAYDVIVRATADAMAGRVDAVATAPVNKEAFALAGLPWRGHTDLLGHLTGSAVTAMMFDAPGLRVVLATVHIPLSEVPSALTKERLMATIRLTARELPRFGCATPRIAVAGLNPHAGEHGLMGREDEDVIRPSVMACRSVASTVDGPFAADTIFLRAHRGEFDVGRGLLPRSGTHSREAARIRSVGERDAGPAHRADIGRSWNGVRHCRPRRGGSRKHGAGGPAGGPPRAGRSAPEVG